MNFVSTKKLGKIALILTAVVFLWAGTFGLLYHIGEMQAGGAMSGCLFNGQMEICAMNLSEHIALWQRMFTALPQNTNLLNIFILASTLVAVVFWRKSLFEFFESIASRWRFYIKQHLQVNLLNPLRVAFARGILNPKIY